MKTILEKKYLFSLTKTFKKESGIWLVKREKTSI